MEFKHILNMSRFSLLWIIALYLPVHGNRQIAFTMGKKHQVSVRSQIGDFSEDLMAESTGTIEKDNIQTLKAEEEKKTLSQQVADGKYGLIQKELFKGPIQRPGVLSYENNSEVPKDNLKNLGGLNKSDIWLAENHLLVIKGGFFPLLDRLPEYSKPEWAPIDDYAAPRRPVKLSKHPKKPPPFPVQLTDGGPLQILGTNFTRILNDTFVEPYAIPPLEDYSPGSGPYFPPPYPYPSNVTTGETPFPIPPYDSPIQGQNISRYPLPPINNGALPPFFDSLPPGSAILPPPNITDQYDEDDLSIYYPPPYSFYYQKDNATEVPPGPLVPGIVLPPPPDFFGVLQQPSPTTTPAPITTTTPISIPINIKTTERTEPIKPSKNKTVNVTILKPVKPTRKPPTVYVYENVIPTKPFEEYGPPPPRQHKITITTTRIPLRAYFTTSGEANPNLVTKPPHKELYATKPKPKPPTRFYYYDDSPVTNSISTPYSIDQNTHLLNLSNEYYSRTGKYLPNPIVHLEQPKYYILPQRPRERIVQRPSTPTNFKTHIVQLQEQIRSYQRPIEEYRQTVVSPKPVYQYSFEVANYQEQHDRLRLPINYQQQTAQNNYRNVPKYTVQIEPAVEITTTESPVYYQEEFPRHKYYTNNPPRYNYQSQQTVTPQPINDDAYKITPNPIYQAYYTKQDEQFFDDITKKYFTTFGKKLRPTTTPMPEVKLPSSQSNRPQIIYTKQRVSRPQYVQQSNPRENILVNYINRRPTQTEYIQPYPQITKQVPQFIQAYESPVNYRQKIPTNNVNVQTIQAISLSSDTTIGEGKPGSFISYELPGDNGAHFYFLTPQLTKKGDSDSIAYYYTQPSNSGIRQSSQTRSA